MKGRSWPMAVVLALTMACTPGGDGDGNGSGGAGGSGGTDGGLPPVGGGDLSAAASNYAGFLCDLIDQCRRIDDELLLFGLLVDSGGDCRAHLSRRFVRAFTDEFAQGVTFDASAFARCRDVALANCVDIDDVPGCDHILVGDRPEGTLCVDSDTCAPGLICEFDRDAEGLCSERCQARRTSGAACQGDYECADTDDGVGFCLDDDDGSGVCAVLTLGGLADAGTPCGLLERDGGWARVGCGPGSFCTAENSRDAGVCRLSPALGEACQDDDVPCEGGYCIAGTCTEVDIITEAGAPCDTDLLQLCNPLMGLICIDDTCARGDGTEGSVCSDRDLGVPCDPGLFCGSGSTCRPQQPDGTPCDPNADADECSSGFCERSEDGNEGLCAPDPYVAACR